jgi:hypothetical protein
MTPIRILVTGSRNWEDVDLLGNALSAAAEGHHPVTLVSGACPTGADRLAEIYASMCGWIVETHAADWNGPCRVMCKPGHRRTGPKGDYCPAAGNYRNQAMVDLGADVLIGAPLPGGTGTQDCMDRARRAGIRVVDITRPEPEGLW